MHHATDAIGERRLSLVLSAHNADVDLILLVTDGQPGVADLFICDLAIRLNSPLSDNLQLAGLFIK